VRYLVPSGPLLSTCYYCACRPRAGQTPPRRGPQPTPCVPGPQYQLCRSCLLRRSQGTLCLSPRRTWLYRSCSLTMVVTPGRHTLHKPRAVHCAASMLSLAPPCIVLAFPTGGRPHPSQVPSGTGPDCRSLPSGARAGCSLDMGCSDRRRLGFQGSLDNHGGGR